MIREAVKKRDKALVAGSLKKNFLSQEGICHICLYYIFREKKNIY